MPVLAKTFVNVMSLVFLTVAGIMIFNPSLYLSRHGLFYKTLDISAKAEVRAYYLGASLAMAFTLKNADTRTALQVIAVTLSGNCLGRLLGYYGDGVDSNPLQRQQMHITFVLEVAGCLLALGFVHYSRDAKLIEKRGLRHLD